jgi:hypothetical protein
MIPQKGGSLTAPTKMGVGPSGKERCEAGK